MTVTGLGTYPLPGQGKNHFSTAGQQETCTNSEQWALWSLRSDVSCGNLADLQACHCDFRQSETVQCERRLWTGSGLRLTTIWVRD